MFPSHPEPPPQAAALLKSSSGACLSSLGSPSAAFMGPPPIRAGSLSELGGWSLGCGTGAAPTAVQRAPGEGWGQSQILAGQQKVLASVSELLIRVVNWHSRWSGWGWGLGAQSSPGETNTLLVSRCWLRRGERLWLMTPLCKGRAVFWEEGQPRESNQQRKRPRKLPPVSSRPGSPGTPAVLTAP